MANTTSVASTATSLYIGDLHPHLASNTPEIECEGPELRRLGSVRTIAIGVFVYTSALYDYAKQNHRLLTLPARLVEVPVKAVLGPICNRFRNLPEDLVVLANTLADNVAARYNAYAPSSVKRLMWPFNAVVRKLIHKAVIVANEAQAGGPQAAARYVAVQSQKFVIKSIGKGEKVINTIRQETNAYVKIVDPFPGAKDRVIIIYSYVKEKEDIEVDDEFSNRVPLCASQDALLKVHAVY